MLKLYKFEISKILTKGRIDNGFEPVSFKYLREFFMENNKAIIESCDSFITYLKKYKIDRIKKYRAIWARGFLVHNMSIIFDNFNENYILKIINEVNKLSFIRNIKIISSRHFVYNKTRCIFERNIELNETFHLFVILYELGIIMPDNTPREILIDLIKKDKEFYNLVKF